MNYTCVFFGVLFLVAGILFACGKLHIHLSVWKKMPDEEKSKIHIRPVCLNIGIMVMLNGLIFLLRGLIAEFTSDLFTIAIVIWMIVAGLDVWYISKSKRFSAK